MAIHFFSESTSFELAKREQLTSWIESGLKEEGFSVGEINFIFCSDDYLLDINRKHLDHDYYTDIITFDYTDESLVSGDIFISIDRVEDNSMELKLPFQDELHRVMAHGILHLSGYNDKTSEQQAEMTKREDFWLSLRPF